MPIIGGANAPVNTTGRVPVVRPPVVPAGGGRPRVPTVTPGSLAATLRGSPNAGPLGASYGHPLPPRLRPVLKYADHHLFAPIASAVSPVIDFVERPAYAVGALIAHPTNPVAAGRALVGGSLTHISRGPRVMPGDAIAGYLPGGTPDWLKAAIGFSGNLGLDPLTYATLGVGAGAKAGEEAGLAAARLAYGADAASGGLTMERAAEHALNIAELEKNTPGVLRVGLRVPFTRGNVVGLETRLFHEAASGAKGVAVRAGTVAAGRFPELTAGVKATAGKITDTGKYLFKPAGVGNPVVHAAYTGARFVADAERHASQTFWGAIDHAITVRAREIGVTPQAANEHIAQWLDNPTVHQLPTDPGLADIAQQVADRRSQIYTRDLQAGVADPAMKVDSYFPHRGATPGARAQAAQRFPSARNIDNPFFTKARHPSLPTLDAWLQQGLKPELNVARAFHAREALSIDARLKQAVDRTVARRFAVTDPAQLKTINRAREGAVTARANLEAAQARLGQALTTRDTTAAMAEHAQAREALTAAKTNARAAATVRPVAPVHEAQAALADAQTRAADLAGARKELAVARAASVTARRRVAAAKTAGDRVAMNASTRALDQAIRAERAASDRYIVLNAAANTATHVTSAGEERVARAAEEARSRAGVLQGARFAARVAAKSPDQALLARTGRAADAAAERLVAAKESATQLGKAQSNLAKAKARLARAVRSGDQGLIQQANRQVRTAAATERSTAVALAAVRGRPELPAREIAAAGKQIVKRTQQAARAERSAARAEQLAGRLEATGVRVASPEEWKTAREQWQQIEQKHLSDTRVPPDVHKALQDTYKRIRQVTSDPSELAHVKRFGVALNSVWKKLALATPHRVIRDTLDEGFRSYIAGARNPRSFLQAGRVMQLAARDAKGDKTAGELLDRMMVNIRGKEVPARDLVRQVEQLGAVNRGWAAYEVGATIKPRFETRGATARALGKTVPRRAPGQGAVVRGVQHVSAARENVIRFGTFLERLKAGDTPVQAARMVREHLWDYGETSRAVENGRRFWVPLMTYTAKAIPYTARTAVRRPGFLINTDKTLSALNQAGGGQGVINPKSLLYRERMSGAIPAPGWLQSLFGADSANPLMADTGNMMFYGTTQDVNPLQFAHAATAGAGAFGELNPFYSTALEMLAGKHFYSGTAFPKLQTAPWMLTALHNAGVPVPTYVPASSSGKTNYLGQPVAGINPYLADLLQLIPLYGQLSGATGSTAGPRGGRSALNLLTGSMLKPYNAAEAQYYAGRR